MENIAKQSLAAFIFGVLAIVTFDASAAVPPLPPEAMFEEATHVVRGEVVGLTSETQKAKYGGGLLIARDRIFKVTLKLTAVDKGKGVKKGEGLAFEAWQPSTRIPPMPGPQGHQPVPDKGDLVKTYLRYNKKTKSYHPFMPNGIEILEKGK